MFHQIVLRNSHSGNVTKIHNISKVFLLVCFTQIYSEIATGNVTKIQKNSKMFLLVYFTQMYSEIATGNVTKIQKNSRIIIIIITTNYTPPPLATANVTKN